MELLRQLIEVGVVGLAAYILMVLSIVGTARAPIRARGPDSRVALAAAATAVSFLVVSTLFDVMSFPHCPYILLWMGGLLAVPWAPTSEGTTNPSRRRVPRGDAAAGRGWWRCSPCALPGATRCGWRGRQGHESERRRDARHLAKAFSEARGGDTIVLASGDYGTFKGGPRVDGDHQARAGGAGAMELQLHSASHLRLQGLTIAGAEIGADTHDMTIARSRFTASADVDATEMVGADILLDRDTFSGINVCSDCFEGRVTVHGREGRPGRSA